MKGRIVKMIKEIAAECGVSEQAVRGWCRRNHVAKDAKGSFALSESQKNSIEVMVVPMFAPRITPAA